jgi:peptide-methionine (S)-S-oxide reductase
MWFSRHGSEMVAPEDALPGRDDVMPLPAAHEVLGTPLAGPFPDHLEVAVFGLGCFWGAERLFWTVPCVGSWPSQKTLSGVHTTAVGYAGGFTPNPSYEEVCSGMTGHTEAVLVVFDPREVSYEQLLKVFWEGHDPTQGMRQGNDRGTQYRSAIYTTSPEQQRAAEASRDQFAPVLEAAGFGPITTEIVRAGEPLSQFFFYAEPYHQQYLHKVPNGYCGLGGTGMSCPVGVARTD